MKIKRIHTLFLFFFLLLSTFRYSYALPKIYVKHYDASSGLPQNSVMDILQDQKGLLWFSTWDGLCKFDGYKFTNYKNWKSSNYPMRSNRIDHIMEDKMNNIWILSYDNEPHRFDPRTETFMGFRSLPGYENFTFTCDQMITAPSGKVWLLSEDKGCITVLDQDFNFISYNTDNQTLKNNHVHFIFEDSEANSWILTQQGVSVYDKNHSPIVLQENKHITERAFYTATEINNEVWLGTTEGKILIYHLINKTFRELSIKGNHPIIEIKPIDTSHLLITTNHSFFYVYHIPSNDFTEYNIMKGLSGKQETIIKSYIDKSKRVWFELTQLGASLFDFNNKEIYHYPSRIESPIGKVAAPIFIVLEDKKGNTWIHPKGGGFSLFDPKTHTLKPFYNTPNSPDWKFSGMLHSGFIDKQNNLWLCTHSEGLDKITFSMDIFQSKQIELHPKTPMDNNTRCVFESKDKKMWVSTKEGKVHVFDENQKYLGYLNSNGTIGKGTPITGITYCMMEDTLGAIWIGTKGDGIYKLKKRGENAYHISQFKSDPNNIYSLNNDNIYSLFQDSKGKIWIGTYGGGINLMEEEGRFIHSNNLFISYPQNYGSQVRVINEDSYGNLCIGTTLGLIMFSNDYNLYNNVEFKFYIKQSGEQSLTANDIYDIITTRKKETYIATFGGGINKIDSVDTKGFPIRFKSITRDNGLFSDIALQIIEDFEGNLWISSEGNITVFNPENNKTITHSEIPKIIQGYSFTEGSKCLSASGKIHFGNSGGILTINPFIIQSNNFKPELLFTNLQVNNKNIQANDEGSPLDVNIDYTEKIKLNHNQNSINIEFSALDYVETQQVQYSYTLEGFDKEWITNPGQRIATYNNLNPGNYTFRVRSTNSDGVWVENERTLHIQIVPSFWQTQWATFLYIFLFIVIISLVLRSLIVYFRLKDRMSLEQEEIEMRTRFFMDISHEIRTPLTMIVSPVENLLENKHSEAETNNQLQIIYKNAQRMLRMVNQILDFRKIEKSKLNIQKTSFGVFIDELSKNFFKLAETQGINFSVNDSSENATLWIDQDKIEKLFFNLLSNAFKFTEEGKDIQVNIYPKGNTIALEIKDEGQGIKQEIKDKLFTRFASFSLDKSKPSTGIGLSIVKEIADKHKAKIEVISNENEGSSFIIYFQKGVQHFNENEFDILTGEEAPKITPPNLHINEDVEIENIIFESEHNERKQKETLLIVEDDDDLRGYIVSTLKSHYNLLEARNGKEGYQMAIHQLPDFIISDIMMPEVDGVELLQQLKANQSTSHIPFILLTAKVDMDSRLQGLKYGADDYITKPFSVKYLKARIENIIEQRKRLYQSYFSDEESPKIPSQEVLEENSSFSGELEVITEEDQQFIKDVKAFIEANIDNSDFVVEDIASEMLMSRTVFFNKMKSLTGLAPIEFIREVKIRFAAEIIKTTNLTIKEIAFMVGFSDTKYFSRWFKNIKGMSPSEYRDENRPL